MSDLENLKLWVNATLAREGLGKHPTPELIRQNIERVRPACPDVTNEQAEQLAKEFEAIHGVRMDIGTVLEEAGFEKWLEAAKIDINPYYWDRYRKLLVEKGLSSQVLAPLDNVTDRILGLLENPSKEGKWDRRGMVVGHVQSGKTANYIGLACKAADAGYKVIIIIAGIHNNLRSQTQRRIDEGLTGFDSAKLRKKNGTQDVIGVSRHRFDRQRIPSVFTNTLKDFNIETATNVGVSLQNLRTLAVFVIKKNTSTLSNLVGWLKAHSGSRGMSSITEPMILIDDEADNASINIKKGQGEVSRINGQIRELLSAFDRSCYVGYTATPFANIFIDPEDEHEMVGQDLFPRDFIVSLDPPDNYFGPTNVFGNQENSIVRYIEDNGDILPMVHKIDHQVAGLPESLMRAVRTFVVVRAIRLIRGHDSAHNSMLVNVSRFTCVHSQIRYEIHEFLRQITASVRVNGAKPVTEAVQDSEMNALRSVFMEEFDAQVGESWDEVQQMLYQSASPIQVKEIHSRSSDSLVYSDHESNGLNVIAVGGFSLSRGLTLEGLTVSYFLRNSMMYDTLMQMGRWFGYRDGYHDLCRVWMPEEADGWYSHIADSVEELREDIRVMEASNATPREFGLKVRSHPNTLIVTARNKMGSSMPHVVEIGLAKRFIETSVIRRDESSRFGNYQAAVNLAMSITEQGCAIDKGPLRQGGGWLFRDIPVTFILEFLNTFKNHKGSHLTENGPVKKYIERRAEGELGKWDIFFPGLQQKSSKSLVDRGLGFELVCQRRAPGTRSDNETLHISNKQRVSSRGIEATGLSDEETRQAQAMYRAKKPDLSANGGTNYPDRIYRQVRKRPLLIVHLLAIGGPDDDLSAALPHTAWSISFPKTALEEDKVKYVVNTTWFAERYGDEDEEEAAGDD